MTRGATLVEVLIATVISMAVLALVGGLMMAIRRADSTVEREVSRTQAALAALRRVSRDAGASRGMVDVSSSPGSPGTTEYALQMPSGALVAYELDESGTLWRESFTLETLTQRQRQFVGTGLAYFHLVAIDRGIHLVMELAPAGAGLPWAPLSTGRPLELSLVVRPRGW